MMRRKWPEALPIAETHELTLDRILRRHAVERGAKIALRYGGETRTYAQLERAARQVASGLVADGVQPGDRVAYLGKNTLSYVEYFLGAVRARAVLVPINWRLAEAEVAYIVANARPRSLLVEEPFEPLAGKIAPELPRLTTGGDFTAWYERQADGDRDGASDWHEPLLQLYTSGTTGRPKGAVLTHRSVFGLRVEPDAHPAWYRWSEDDVSLIAMPVAHVSGTGWAIWTLQHGACGIIAREFDPHAVFDQIVEHRISKIMMVPTAMQIAVRHPRARTTDFSFLRYIYYGGAPLPETLLAECVDAFGCGFVQMYGMTETSGTIVALAPEDHAPGKGSRTRSVGRAIHGVEIKIIDDGGAAVAAGVTGEIVTRSAANMAGYFDLPDATAETIDADGWLRTGDAGSMDADGYLFLHDRMKDMIISGGENIYPAEVENAIFGHPSVAEVAVIGVKDDKWGESVKAIIVPVAGAPQDAAAVIAWAADRIARYKLPKSIEWVSALPRNHTGKVLRRELRAQYAAPSDAAPSGAAPSGAAQVRSTIRSSR